MSFTLKLLFIFLLPTMAYTEIWRVGANDNSNVPFVIEVNGSTSVVASSAALIDDHYYLPGVYDTVGVVLESEPETNFERALSSRDAVNQIYFTLTEDQLSHAREFLLESEFIWGGSNTGDDQHLVQLSINDTIIQTTSAFSEGKNLITSVSSSVFVVGANTLRMERIGGTENSWLHIDTVALLESSPLQPDTDNDGMTDRWETLSGTDPESNTSTPLPWDGAIGINFVSADFPYLGRWASQEINGWIPQPYWNHSVALRQWGVGSAAEMLTYDEGFIASQSEQILDSSGSPVTNLSLDFTFNGCPSTHSKGSIESQLMNGFLNSHNEGSAKIVLEGIPYATYDVYIYVATDYDGPTLTTRINEDPETDFTCSPFSFSPVDTFIYRKRTANSRPPYTNVVTYNSLTDTRLTIEAIRPETQTGGIAAIQIVDRLSDVDLDQIPDWYELKYGLLLRDSSDATDDPDLDALTNLEEYLRGTSPLTADTDGDGLSDAVESNTGMWADATDTGTDPLWADSDGDGISDGVEVLSRFPSNPLMTDSDADGTDDKEEILQGFDPLSGSSVQDNVPVNTPGSLIWELSHVQLVWDHEKIATLDWQRPYLFRAVVTNEGEPNITSWTTLQMGLQVYDELRVSPYFMTEHRTGFHRIGATQDVWNTNTSIDLISDLGFSGVGSMDISDPLTLRLQASSDVSDNWTLTYTIVNESSGQTISTQTETNLTAVSSLQSGNAQWVEDATTEAVVTYTLHNGISFYQSAQGLESLISEATDSDSDGMPDSWETLYGLDPNNASDATLDNDGDLLDNITEHRIGSHPLLSDTDNDLFDDRTELRWFTNPADSASYPQQVSVVTELTNDLDASGLPDLWEHRYNAYGLSPIDDTDGDGRSNAEEAAEGTNPYDGNSYKKIRLNRLSDNHIEVRWDTPELHKETVLQYSLDLENWSIETDSPRIDGSELCLERDTSESQAFYRTYTSSPDSDSDGVSDYEEMLLGSDPNSPNSRGRGLLLDTDNDGSPDAESSGDYAALMRLYGSQGALTNLEPVGGHEASLEESARFLFYSSFGPTKSSIQEVRELGFLEWIETQMAMQATMPSDYVNALYEDFYGPRVLLHTYSYNADSNAINGHNFMTAFARGAIQGEDQLRQRVAFALSQILVVSRKDPTLHNALRGITDYYEIFLRHAFGNYRDILREVTYHPAMGRYLSHVGNQPPAPDINRYPDENYAREAQQLFSFGLWELNMDGSQQLDLSGNPIPTYTNEEITESARVLTGFWYGGNPWASGGWQDVDFMSPMDLHVDHHDFGQKNLVNGVIIPAREPTLANAQQDIEDFISAIFDHPSTAPFISKALIQFLVTDNPSPAYIERVATTFADNGSGERGDLSAVIKEILLAPEAHRPLLANGGTPTQGKLREPVLRVMHAARILGLGSHQGLLWWDWGDFGDVTFQEPMSSPSVFNYYRPDYGGLSALRNNGLSGPVFQITNSYTTVSVPNQIWDVIENGFSNWIHYRFAPDFKPFLSLATDAELLLDYINLVCCAGQMSTSTRSICLESINSLPASDLGGRVKVALYLGLMSAECAIQK